MNGMKRYTIRDDDEDGRQKVFDVTISLCYAFYVYLLSIKCNFNEIERESVGGERWVNSLTIYIYYKINFKEHQKC